MIELKNMINIIKLDNIYLLKKTISLKNQYVPLLIFRCPILFYQSKDSKNLQNVIKVLET
jgi:hypothetical protein